jgi:hypothetical protein
MSDYIKCGEDAWKNIPKMNAEVFALTYGAFVESLVKDYADTATVNAVLQKMGYYIGKRLADELFARSLVKGCGCYKDSVEVAAKVFC